MVIAYVTDMKTYFVFNQYIFNKLHYIYARTYSTQ